MEINEKLYDIINFLGIKNNVLLDDDELTQLKKDIRTMYYLLYGYSNTLDLNSSLNDLFLPKYLLKLNNMDSELECSTSVSNNKTNDSDILLTVTTTDVTTKQLTFNIKNNRIEPQYLNNSDESESVLNVNDIIECYHNNIKEYKNCLLDIDNLMTVEDRDNLYEKYINDLKPQLSGSILEKTKHYDYLRNLPQPVQKSKEWFDLRNGMITASSGADILGESKYNTREEMILDKIGLLPDKYKENMFVYHGKKYELIATMIYEQLYNTKVGEFGLVPYQNNYSDKECVNFMGASPDGISTCITLDGKPNDKVGRMLEIKCPLKRKILTKGIVDGEIVPHYYWVQVQLQLACCKNEECDFWQCNIQEYSDDEWMLDNSEDGYIECNFTCEQDIKKTINPKLTKGCIIQLMPKDTSKVPKGDKYEWYAKYIYPSNLLMSDSEYLQWIDYMETDWKKLYPQYANDYYYDKVLYWKLHSCHNILIKRDISWFESKLPLYKKFWEEVLHYRANPELGKQLLDNYLAKKNARSKTYTKTVKPTSTIRKNKSVFDIDSESPQFLDSSEENPVINKQNDIKPSNIKHQEIKSSLKSINVKTEKQGKLENVFIKEKSKNNKKSKLLDNDDDFLSLSN